MPSYIQDQPSSNPLFRLADVLSGGILGAATGDNIKRRQQMLDMEAGQEEQKMRLQSALMEQRVRNEMDLQRARRAEAVGLPANASESQIRAAEHAQSLAQILAVDDAKAGAATKRGLSARGLSVGPQSQPQAMPGTQPLPQEAIQAMASLAGNTGMGMPDAPQAMAPQPSVVSGKTPEQQIAEYDQNVAMDRDYAKREQDAKIAAATKKAEERDATIKDYRTELKMDPPPEHLDANGNLNAAGLGALGTAKSKSKLTQTQRNAEYAVDSGIKAGYIKPEDREQAIAVASTQLMGRFPAFPTNERDMAVGNAKYMQSLDALNALAQESAASGRDDFGPVANRVKKIIGSVTGGFPEARRLEQVYKEAGATKAFGEGGKQLTETEKALTFGQIGSPTDNDFPQRLADHRARVANVIELQLQRLKDGPHQYTPDGQAAIRQLEKALAGATGGAGSVGGKQAAPTPANPADAILKKYGL